MAGKSSTTSFDVKIVQQGEIYIVSGRDAAALREKILMTPKEIRDLDVSPIKDGQFMMRKVIPPYMMQSVS